jgi:predicted HD superfamily hydrolase involved in NAD metabolism
MSERRFLHSVGAARTCVALNRRYGEQLDDDECYRCGLLHDMAREWPAPDLLDYAMKNRLHTEPEETAVPMLLHGPVAAHLLSLKGYGTPLCTAVRYHTLGNIGMGRLGLVLFIADYIEPGRTHVTDGQRQEMLAGPTLESVCSSLLSMQEAYFEKKGRIAAASTKALQRYLQEGGRI